MLNVICMLRFNAHILFTVQIAAFTHFETKLQSAFLACFVFCEISSMFYPALFAKAEQYLQRTNAYRTRDALITTLNLSLYASTLIEM